MPRKKLEELEPAKPVSSNQKPDAEVVVPSGGYGCCRITP